MVVIALLGLLIVALVLVLAFGLNARRMNPRPPKQPSKRKQRRERVVGQVAVPGPPAAQPWWKESR